MLDERKNKFYLALLQIQLVPSSSTLLRCRPKLDADDQDVIKPAKNSKVGESVKRRSSSKHLQKGLFSKNVWSTTALLIFIAHPSSCLSSSLSPFSSSSLLSFFDLHFPHLQLCACQCAKCKPRHGRGCRPIYFL